MVALYRDGSAVDTLSSGQAGIVVLDRTPFYAESGGQVGDRGELSKSGACLTLFAVHDTQKIQAEVFGHHGEVKTGELALGDVVTARVDGHARARAAWNHSATHLMHAALREVLGAHVQQKGSLVDPQRTRFDFSHPQPLTDAGDPQRRSAGQPRHPGQLPGRGATDALRRGHQVGRHGAVRREIRRRGAGTRPWAISPPSCAVARTSSAPATSACSRSSPSPAWPPAFAASRR